MACSSRPPQLQPAAPPPPPARPRPPPPPHLDTTLTLALPPRSLVCALSTRPPHVRRPRPDGGATASSALARAMRSSPTGDDTPPCTECRRLFPSWKALFGHMRSHPERQWGGITPPPHFRHVAAAADKFTAQERDAAASLLMLAGARPGADKKSIPAASSSRVKESGSTSTSSPTAPAPPGCGDHKCGACARVFATGQALGRHKRTACVCVVVVVVATPASSCSALLLSEEAPATTLLELNLPPAGMPLPRESDQGGSLNVTLDLKLGY